MNYKNHIFDVGAYNGIDGLALAYKNPKFFVHAFEANPDLINLIKKNKTLIENYRKIKIKNYKINNCAVSNKEDYLDFNIAKNPTVSSLNKFSENLDVSWNDYKEAHLQFVNKIKVKVTTLEKYCLDNDIRIINYLHIDTQGSDLKVLKGLKSKMHILQKGVLEAAVNKKKILYQDNHTIEDVKKFLSEQNFKINKIEDIDENIKNEKNIYFQKEKLKNNDNLKLNYNVRYFNRIVSNRLNLKDKFFDYFKIFSNFR